ncbi:MAG: DUF1704 domain-containing protein [Xanthomonadales bacterium]|nr:DUF1704 domain-containing protein [Xanthomonadales bacterium]
MNPPSPPEVAPGTDRALREQVIAATRLLADAARPLRVLRTIDWPIEARKRFLAAKGKVLPSVSYEQVDASRSLRKVERARRIRTGHATIDAWLTRHADAIQATAGMLQGVGTPDFYRHGRTLYGDSSTPLKLHPATPLDMARSIHQSIEQLARIRVDLAPAATHTATQVARIIRKELSARFGADAPAVTLVPTLSANALATSKEIRIRRDARFTDRDAQQLLQHEAWIHVGTSINGRHQDLLPILGVSYPYTTRTQEGLAVFAEIISSTMELDRFRRLADRVVAIQMAADGADFLEVYRWFLERVGQAEQAYENTRRVYRGGVITGGAPFTKDVSYVFGLLQVSNMVRAMFAAGRADVLRLLFCGKLDVQDLPVLCELAALGLCRAPRHRPPWATDPRSLLATLAYSTFINQIDLEPLTRYATQLVADSPIVSFESADAA